MINSITVTNPSGKRLVIDVKNPNNNGLIVASIDGLTAVEADVNTSNWATGDGTMYNSARIGQRNIVLKFYFQDNPTVESNRALTYEFFPTKKEVSLKIDTDSKTVVTSGYVESNEADIFEKQTGCQISIICPDPFLYDVNELNMDFSGIESLFEFPFEKDLEDTTKIEMSEVRIIKHKSLYYTGASDVGITLKAHCTGEVQGLKIYDLTTGETIEFDDDIIESITGSKLQTGDDITLVTIRGKKSVTLVRDGVSYSIINAVGRNASWFKVYNGDNIFSYTATVGEFNLQIKINNRISYEGV